MKSLWVPAVLLLLANNVLAEDSGMQQGLQQILDDRSAELNQRFEVKLNKLIDSCVLDATAGPAGASLENNLEEPVAGNQPRYFAWHLAR